jgi:hypothetical protein
MTRIDKYALESNGRLTSKIYLLKADGRRIAVDSL